MTATAEDALGRAVTASATAALHERHRPVITETVVIEVDVSPLREFASLLERHAEAIRRALERFEAREEREG